MHLPFDEVAWTALVDDLDASVCADREALVREVAAAHAAELHLHQRLTSAVGGPIRVRLAPCPEIDGTLMRVGHDHLWVADAHGYWLLVTAELDGLSGMGAAGTTSSASPVASPTAACGLASALRELVGIGGSASLLLGHRWLDGRLSIVGADFLEIDEVVVPLRRVRACRVWY